MQTPSLVFPKKELIQEFIRKYLLQPNSDNLKINVVSLEYVNNSTYVGEAEDEIKQGKGVYQYSNGDVYAGDWLNDTFEGEGTYIFSNGEFFTGRFTQGQSTKGVYYYLSGNIYIGDFLQFKKNGKGKMTYVESQAYYEGEWSNGEKHGYGVYKCPSYTYEGSWSNGKKIGKCKVTGEEISFVGEALHNKLFKGEAKIFFQDGSHYVGDIQQCMKEGKGVYTVTNKFQYEGTFEADSMTGVGKSTFSNGVYEGEIADGVRSGNGTYTFSEGGSYAGKWANNMRQGQGKMTLPNGDVYDGEIYLDKKHGRGKYTFSDGSVYEGDFVHGLREGIGRLSDQRFSYSGEWSNDQMNGQGVLNGIPVVMVNNQVSRVSN